MKKLVKDMVLNIIFITGGIVVALLIPTQVKGMNASVQMGPDFFPYIAAGLMVAVNGIALVTNYRRYQKERATGTEELVQKTDPKDQLRVLLILALVVGYILCMPVVGYVISTLVIVNVLLFILGVRKWCQYLLVSGFSMVIYCVFKNILYVMLP